ncbi:hypothetical protein GGF31_007715 [Allomyces arbusculus]|nr:hypothetical protein GGF31_007715 [Allomyces arbusculus]
MGATVIEADFFTFTEADLPSQIVAPTHRGGPPDSVSVELYRALLKDAFDEVKVSECESLPRCEGLEKLGVWRRKEATLSCS